MTHTITALFDDRRDADAAKARLVQSRVDADNIHIHDKTSDGYSETGRSTQQDRGMWASIKNVFLPDNDRFAYEEGVRRGGVLLTADVDDDAVADAVRVLEEADTIDIDARSETWRASGWDDAVLAGATGGAAGAAGDRDPAGAAYGRRNPAVGGARARTYVNDPLDASDRSTASRDAGTKAAGLANEAIGNVKQTAGALFGNDRMTRDGVAQERKGEGQQGKGPDALG